MSRTLFFISLIFSTLAYGQQPPMPNSKTTSTQEAKLNAAFAYLNQDNPLKAYEAAVHYQKEFPDDPRGEEICRKASDAYKLKFSTGNVVVGLSECIFSNVKSDQLYKEATDFFQKQKYSDALNRFQRLMLGMRGDDPRQADVHYHVGESYLQLGGYAGAAMSYGSIYQNYPKDPRVDEAKKKEKVSLEMMEAIRRSPRS